MEKWFPVHDPVLIFAMVMLFLLLAPIFARKLRLPEIVGLIVIGIIAGPHGLNILERDETIVLLGTVGLLFIMFLAGLEIDLNEVRRNRLHTVIFGLITFTVPLGLGILLGVYLFAMALPVAVLLASMFSSHTLLSFPIIAKLGLTRSRASTTTIGGTIITDMLALIVLAVIAGMSRGTVDTIFWIRMIVLIAVYLTAVLLVVPLLSKWFFRKVSTDDNLNFIFVLAVAFVCSFLAHLAGLEPIIGAFLAGITLNTLIPEKSLLMTRLHFTGNALFIPFFLISVGMLVDLSLLFTGARAWIISGGMIAVAIFSKYIAAKLSGAILGYHREEGKLMFGLSVNQAAATLAAALVGYDLGLFDEGVITGTIIMIAVTCFIGPIITEKAGRRLSAEKERKPFSYSSPPHRIMAAIERRENARDLIDYALLFRERNSHEPLYSATVVLDEPDVDAKVASAETLLAHTVSRALAAGVPVNPVTVLDLSIAAGIVRTARTNRISMIILGWRETAGQHSRVFGRIIDRIVRETWQAVNIVRLENPINTTEKLLLIVPPLVQRHPGFEDAVRTAKHLAQQAGSSLTVAATAETLLSASQFIEQVGPKVKTSLHTVSSFTSILEEVRPLTDRHTWLIFMYIRPGEIAWQPSLDKLPRRLAEIFPKVNFSVLTASPRKWTGAIETGGGEDRERLETLIPEENAVLGLGGGSVEVVIATVIAKRFGEHTDIAGYLTTLLVSLAKEEPIELTEGIVLVHTHIPMIEAHEILLSSSTAEIELPNMSAPVRALIIVLDPVGSPPELHLEILSRIVKLLQHPGVAEILKTGGSYRKLQRKLSDADEDS
jgi:Kef-type K+ transport system membrane component KefB/mannitol/fructose-specific phosphotransferase system IIA component (Ntr-type)